MSRKNHETDYAAALENDYARWYELFTKGGFDPSWADGSNLNLVRNHILYDKEQLAKQETSLDEQLSAYAEQLYGKIVPQNVRDFIDMTAREQSAIKPKTTHAKPTNQP